LGLVKKAVRRATPRPVRKAQRVVRHPARSIVRAATPRAVREVQRTAFNVTHPVNTAENALLGAVPSRSSERRRARPVASSPKRTSSASWREAPIEKVPPWRRRDRERYDMARVETAAERLRTARSAKQELEAQARLRGARW
jgi:hypothetical protein